MHYAHAEADVKGIERKFKRIFTPGGPEWEYPHGRLPEIPERRRNFEFYSRSVTYASASISTSISGEIKALT
jgi:hypothetical protein